MTQEHIKDLQKNNEKVILEKRTLIEKSEKQIVDYKNELEKINAEIHSLKNNINDEETVSKKINKLSQLKHQITAKSKVLKENIEFFSNNESCPTCGQDIETSFKHNCITENKTKLSEIEKGLVKLSEEYDSTNKRLNEIMEVTSDIRNREMKTIEIKTTINSLNKHIEQFNQEISNISEINSDSVSDNKISEYKKELNQLEKKYNELVEDKHLYQAASVLLKDTGIKSKIIKQYIPVINKLINKYLSSMDFFVSFELDENFNETIKSRYRDNFTYASFSEGEKQKIDLALLFTWRAVAKLRNSINTNLLIMDEVFDSSLDQNATDYLTNIIYDVAKNNNVFIISHKEHMNEKFSNVLRFKKVKNFSQLEE